MSKALFVTRHDISVFTAANGNIDNDKLLPFINQAQDIHIQNYLGTDLYVSETPGTLTATAPSDSDDFVQIMGVAIGVRSAFINPDMTIVKID